MVNETFDTTMVATETQPQAGSGNTPPAVEESRSKRAMDRARPLLFVLAGFVCWFSFVTLARVVFKCAPNFQCTMADLGPPAELKLPDTIVLLTTLCFAVWAARRLVFPRED